MLALGHIARAKQSTSEVAIPSRFIPVSIFRWNGIGRFFPAPRRVRAPAKGNCWQRSGITAVQLVSTSSDASPGKQNW